MCWALLTHRRLSTDWLEGMWAHEEDGLKLDLPSVRPSAVT